MVVSPYLFKSIIDFIFTFSKTLANRSPINLIAAETPQRAKAMCKGGEELERKAGANIN
jgi:hypothetical protein